MNTKLSDIKHEKHEVDASGEVLGRLAARIATRLTGKNKPYFVRHLDCGDFVTVSNAAKIRVTGQKLSQKVYTRFSGYPGGLKKTPMKKMMAEKPTEVIRHAVAGMLPKNKLQSVWLKRLTIKP